MNELAGALSSLNMFPYFDAAHYIVSVMSLREQPGKQKSFNSSESLFNHTLNTKLSSDWSVDGMKLLLQPDLSLNFSLYFISFLCERLLSVYTVTQNQ